MRIWVRQAFPAGSGLAPEHRLRRLFEALVSRDGLYLKQKGGHTPSAGEAFAARQANCAAFAFLFVALAREVGVPVYFVLTRDDVRTKRHRRVRLTERHVAAAYGPLARPTVFDFGGFRKRRREDIVFVSDEKARSIFCSNRGVEDLIAGKRESALSWLRSAVRIDGAHADAWLNLGVVLRIAGDFDGAERAYKCALELDPGLEAARNNLAYLGRVRGRSFPVRFLPCAQGPITPTLPSIAISVP